MSMRSAVEYYRRQLGQYRQYLLQASHDPAPEVIHELRLSIKRLKTLYYLTEFIDPSFKLKKRFAAFNAIFSPAGALRDIDIAIELLSNITSKKLAMTGTVLALLKEQRRIRATECKSKAAKAFAAGVAEDTAVYAGLTKITNAKLKRFLKNIEEEIGTLRKKHLSITRIHAIRKGYKRYGYALEASSGAADIPKKILKRQKVIGRWHDYSRAKAILQEQKSPGELLDYFRSEEKGKRKNVIKEISGK